MFSFELLGVGVLGFECEFVGAFVRFVEDLVEVFFGVLLLGFVVRVRAIVPEVVRGPVGGVDHVCGLEEIRLGEVVCLGPNVFAVEGVDVEL